MRIAFVYDIPYPWHKGGIEHILNVEARELAKKHKVHFFTMRWPGMRSKFSYQNVTYHAFGTISEEEAYKHGRRSIREAVRFSRYMRNLYKYDFDVVITNAFPILHLQAVKSYCRSRKAKLILKVDEVWDRSYWVNYLGPVFGDVANAYATSLIKIDGAEYVANSSSTAEKLVRLGIEERRIRVFAPVLEDNEMAAIRKASRKRYKRVIFSGRLIKEKRVDKWLHMMKQVIEKDSSISGLLIGDGVERNKIAKEMKALGLAGNVEMRGFFKDKRGLYKAIAESKLLLHMGEREGLSIIALESLALGTPVMVPDYSPIPKIVRDMCVVEKEGRIPSKILEVMGSGGRYIKNEENLETFSTSNVIPFYDKLFLTSE